MLARFSTATNRRLERVEEGSRSGANVAPRLGGHDPCAIPSWERATASFYLRRARLFAPSRKGSFSVLRFRTAALAALLVPLVLLSACAGGSSGSVLPTAQQNPGAIHPLTSSASPNTTSPLPVSTNCPGLPLPPSAARVGIHAPPVQRLGGGRPAELVGAGVTMLPARPGCGGGIARPKHTMAWSGCSDGAGENYGCGFHEPVDDVTGTQQLCHFSRRKGSLFE